MLLSLTKLAIKKKKLKDLNTHEPNELNFLDPRIPM